MPVLLGIAGGPLAGYIAVAVPWIAALVVAVYRRHVRIIGFVAALISTVACVLPLGAPVRRPVVVPGLDASVFLPDSGRHPDSSAPRLHRWEHRRHPFPLGIDPAGLHCRPSSCIARRLDSVRDSLLRAALVPGPLLAPASSPPAFDSRVWVGDCSDRGSAHTFWIVGLKGQSPGGMAAFGLMVMAVIFRKGILPAHAWVADAAEAGPAIPTALTYNGHFGALLVAKLIVPLFAGTTVVWFPVLSYLAIATALYVAIRALTENSPRRLLAFIALSQSAAILAGLESGTAEGITGALVHWYVITVSTVGLFGILRLLEVRFGENLTVSTHLGLAGHAPRLAVSFAVLGLGARRLTRYTQLLFPGPLDSWNAPISPAHGIAASHRHRDERHERFSLIYPPVSG